MSAVKGMGKCLINRENGIPCGRQISEGEPIGTVINPGGMALTGHKACADGHYRRIQDNERAKREEMVQQIKQSGAGGPVDPRTASDALAFGSIPLDRKQGEVKPDDLQKVEEFIGVPGVRPVADLPFEEGSFPTGQAGNVSLSTALSSSNSKLPKLSIQANAVDLGEYSLSANDADELAQLLSFAARHARRLSQ